MAPSRLNRKIGALPTLEAIRKPPHKLEKLDVEGIKARNKQVQLMKGGPVKPTQVSVSGDV